MDNFIMVLDTETVSLEKPFVYDIGFIVAQLQGDRTYKEVERKQFIITNVYDNKELFQTAYYEKKRPLYTSVLKGKKAKKIKIGYATQSITETIKKYDIKKVFAYNASFDKKVFTFNCEYFKLINPFECLQWLDIQGVASEFIHSKKEYKNFSEKNCFVGDSGYIKTNAEATYSFIINDINYKEPHISIGDCEIELKILNKCIELGYNGLEDFKQRFFTSDLKQTLNIITENKTYNFGYRTKRNTKKGILLKN